MRIIPLLFFLSFINVQIALPTFQAVHTPHTAEAESGSQTFSYTGAQQTFTVPSGVSTITIQAYGAQGGNSLGVVGGLGGTGGNGGVTFTWRGWHPGTGGGGLLTDGVGVSGGASSYGTDNNPGLSFLNGGAGGIGGSSGRNGGFGGGGSAGYSGAGGGGYSGGGSGSHQSSRTYSGGGGGSYNVGANQTNTAGANTGNGQIVISW